MGDLSEQGEVNPSIGPIVQNVNEMIKSASEFYSFLR